MFIMDSKYGYSNSLVNTSDPSESSKKMAAAMQVQAEALAKEAVNATLNTLLQHIGAYPIDHPVRKEMDRQVSELLGMAPKDCYT